jgi:hypothetical protein
MSLPPITNKQTEILKYLYHFRFLNRIQIQALLKHKDYKTINLWLKDLTEKEYTERIYSTKYGEINKPAIYYIGPNGVKHLRVNTNCPKEQINKLGREKDRSQSFISNCQFLADIYIDLKNKSNEKLKYSAKTKSDFTNPDSPLRFLAETTADMVVEKDDGSMKKYYLLEIIDDTLPGYMIKKRIKSYIDLYFSNSWEDNTGENFPTIILVCETLPILMSIKRYAKNLLSEYDDIDLKIQLATEQEVKKNGKVIF